MGDESLKIAAEREWNLDEGIAERIREELMQYEAACMERLEECIPMTSHAFSRRYARRMERLLWSQRHFGSDVRMGLVVRRVVMAALVFLALFLGNAASGRYLGFNVWDSAMKLLGDGIGKRVTYYKKEEVSWEESRVAKRAEPIDIPEGFAETDREDFAGGDYLDIVWYQDGMESIRYIRTVLEDGMEEDYIADVEDSRWFEVMGISVNREVTKDGLVGLTWCDAKYNYQLEYDEGTISDEEAYRMIESMYE